MDGPNLDTISEYHTCLGESLNRMFARPRDWIGAGVASVVPGGKVCNIVVLGFEPGRLPLKRFLKLLVGHTLTVSC